MSATARHTPGEWRTEYYRQFFGWLDEFETAIRVQRPVDPRDPDPSRSGIFRDHNCSRCRDGRDLSRCPTPERPGNCGYPYARND